MKILGIETSCDETAVCVIEAHGAFPGDFSWSVLGDALYSQASKHAEFGGVFPNLAKREHELNLVPLLTHALGEARLLNRGPTSVQRSDLCETVLERETELRAQLEVFLNSYACPDIDAIAVTVGPGLEPALWVGVNFARTLSVSWSKPLVPVNHMEGHIAIALFGDDKGKRDQVMGNSKNTTTYKLQTTTFPIISLLISGGHTELLLSREWLSYERLGETRDDAVGEAYDKVARLLDLPYPGGPEIARLAEIARTQNLAFDERLPRPMLHTPDYEFSFSGLKTAVRRIVEARAPLSESDKLALAREFEEAITDVLVAKTTRAIEEYGVRTLVLGGGVSANTHLRASFKSLRETHSVDLRVPEAQLATDNAVMIALSGYFHALRNDFSEPESLRAQGNLKLSSHSR